MITLDKRVKPVGGRYPVSLMVTFQEIRGLKKVWKQVYYRHPKKYYLSPSEFEGLWKSRALEIKEIRQELIRMDNRAKEIIEQYDTYTRRQFELYFLLNHNPKAVKGQFELKIDELSKTRKISSKEKYETALQSFIHFFGDGFSFYDCTSERLQDYEDDYIRDGGSLTSVGINMRCLRHIFRRAIKARLIPDSVYPFGTEEGLYCIPEGEGDGSKQHLTTEQKNQFLAFEFKNAQAEMHDYAVFIYYAHGLNPADVFRLRKSQIHDDHLVLSTREKVKGKRKKKIKTYEIPLNSRMKRIIARRGVRSLNPNEFIFPLLNDEMGEEERFRKVRYMTRKIDRVLEAMARSLGWGRKPTIYTLRHTFSNEYMQAGATTEELQDALMHGSKKTTETYKHGFGLERKKNLSSEL